jgi:hypothetical protein
MKKKLIKIVNNANLSKHLACHLVGEDHTNTHRRIFGVCIMCIGLALGKVELYNSIVHFITEVGATIIHAIGLIPFVHSIEHKELKQ